LIVTRILKANVGGGILPRSGILTTIPAQIKARNDAVSTERCSLMLTWHELYDSSQRPKLYGSGQRRKK
jgi:hypothetical protein